MPIGWLYNSFYFLSLSHFISETTRAKTNLIENNAVMKSHKDSKESKL
jgi:hypothetical protein